MQILNNGVRFNINENLDIDISRLTERMNELFDNSDEYKLYHHHKRNNYDYYNWRDKGKRKKNKPKNISSYSFWNGEADILNVLLEILEDYAIENIYQSFSPKHTRTVKLSKTMIIISKLNLIDHLE